MKKDKAFIGILVLVVVAILLISYLGFDLKKIFTSDIVKNNFSYVWNFAKEVWETYLVGPWNFIWDQAFKPLFTIMWNGFLSAIEGIRNANAK